VSRAGPGATAISAMRPVAWEAERFAWRWRSSAGGGEGVDQAAAGSLTYFGMVALVGLLAWLRGCLAAWMLGLVGGLGG